MIAISAFARQRNIQYVAYSLAAVGPENINKAAKQFRSLLFPEEGYDELAYIKKAKEMFEKLKKVDLRVNV